MGLGPFLDVRELADDLDAPISTVHEWRTHGREPAAHRFGKHLKFTVTDVRTWVEQQRDTTAVG